MIDFSKHIVLETHYRNENTKHTLDIWDLKLPNSDYKHRVRFVNSCGTLTVNGDFGNWVFCREFHPSIDGKVFSGYWSEKLRIHSEQTSAKYDSERTLEAIGEFEKEYLEHHSEGNVEDEILDWIERLKDNVDDEIEYKYIAYREKPEFVDYEEVPYVETGHRYLGIVYEAFNELCKRIKNDNNNNK